MALKQAGLKTTEPQKSFVNKGKSKVIISNNLGRKGAVNPTVKLGSGTLNIQYSCYKIVPCQYLTTLSYV